MAYRVHEVAKMLKISTAALKKRLLDLGIVVKSHMTPIEDDIINVLIPGFKDDLKVKEANVKTVLDTRKVRSELMKEKEDKKKFMKNLVSNYKIFVDTCSFLHHNCEKLFQGSLFDILVETEKKIIVPRKVIEELNKHLKSNDSKLREKAKKAISIIKNYQVYNIVTIQGEKNDSFADNLFISVFAKFRMKYNLCLITQDTGLSIDILNLKKSASVNFIKDIKVMKLSYPIPNLVEFNERVKKHNIKQKTSNSVIKFTRYYKPLKPKENILNCRYLPKLKQEVFSKKYGKQLLIKQLAKGGEGIAYLTDNQYVCKVYKKEKLRQNKYDKLKIMVSKPIEKEGICWPLDLIYNKDNEFVGYLMKKADGFELQKSVFLPMLLQKRFPDWQRYNLVKLSETILNLIYYLHERNVIIGDLNPFNILVKSETKVYFIDTDSFQIENYPCTVGTVNYTAPEIQGKDYKTFLRTLKHEQFAVATLLFMILLPGKPPYSQQGGGNPSSNIKKQDFSYPLGEHSNKKTPPGQWRYIWSNLPFKLKEAFYNTFRNNNRLSVNEWIKIISSYLNDVKKKYVTNELFPNHLKIVDPIDVICEKCGKKYIESKSFVEKLKLKNQNPICSNCRLGFVNHNNYRRNNTSGKSSRENNITSNNILSAINVKSQTASKNTQQIIKNTKQTTKVNPKKSLFEDFFDNLSKTIDDIFKKL